MKPDYSAQTFAPDNVATRGAIEEWVRARADEAKAQGCKIVRATRTEDGQFDFGEGLLVEGWKSNNHADCDEPFWHLVAA